MENRLGKFAVYAAGEILLVVIGILIALQINNWNDQRKEALQIRGYLYKIAKDMMYDSIDITALRVRRDSVQKQTREVARLIATNDMSDLGKIVKGDVVFYEFYFNARTGGYEALKNSQFLGKIQNTLLDSLVTRYYSIVENIRSAESSANTFIEEMESKLKSEVDFSPMLYLLYQLRNKGMTMDEVFEIDHYRNGISKIVSHPAFKAAVMRTSREGAYRRLYTDLTSTASKYIEELERIYPKLGDIAI